MCHCVMLCHVLGCIMFHIVSCCVRLCYVVSYCVRLCHVVGCIMFHIVSCCVRLCQAALRDI